MKQTSTMKCCLFLLVLYIAFTSKGQAQEEHDHAILLETASWNVERNQILEGEKGDFRLDKPEGRKELTLISNGGARIKLLQTKKFEAINRNHLKRIIFNGQREVSKDELKPGSILAARTSEGNLMKLRVVKLRRSNELPEQSMKQLEKLGIQDLDKRVHLELEWKLFEGTYETTVLLGTWTWDLDTNAMGRGPGADVFWQQVNEQIAMLTPQNGAQIALTEEPFERITRGSIDQQKLSRRPISKAKMKAGTAIVFRTSDGRVGKMRVKQYRALHDFSFPEARHLTARWRQFVLTKRNQKSYHVELEWMLFAKDVKPGK